MALGAMIAAACAMAAPRGPQRPRAPNHPAWQMTGFEGAWCAQGDPKKKCSVSSDGHFLTFKNEVGSKSSAHIIEPNVMSADQWHVKGTLAQNGQRIDWSNGTFWARCSGTSSIGRPIADRTPKLDGMWFQSGDRSKSCYIRQRDRSLTLTNEVGQNATGQIDGPDRITTFWSGKRITGRISGNGNVIHWDNGTAWSR